MTTDASRQLDDTFESAWREVIGGIRPMLDLEAALVKSTDAGAFRVPVEALARQLDKSEEETRHLAAATSQALSSVDIPVTDGQASLDFSAKVSGPRYTYRIGERVIVGGGCALDLFVVAQAYGKPFQVESTCPATGARILVEFTGEGVGQVEPTEAVVALIHPHAVPPEALEFTDAEQLDAAVCSHQPFLASSEAANKWLAAHSGGRVMTVPELYEWGQTIFWTPGPAN
jgi:hypothetical protein